MRFHGFLLWLGLLVASPVWAQAPQSALQLMPRGAISLRWQKLETREAAGPVWLHLYCVPKGHAEELQSLDIKRSGPVKREHITTGPSLKTSPYWMDVFRAQGTTWQRLNSVRFEQSKDAQEIVLRWMGARNRRGPVLALHFGYTHWHEWVVLTFPRGWNQKAFAQTFLWGGEGEYGVYQRFDRRDARGRLVVAETDIEGEKSSTHLYRWNGFEWEDPTQKYFVIGASTKSQAEAQAILAKRGFGEMLWSNNYPRLQRGYYLWVPGRFRTIREAQELVSQLKKDKTVSYVRRVR
jgi:hypothetical protein